MALVKTGHADAFLNPNTNARKIILELEFKQRNIPTIGFFYSNEICKYLNIPGNIKV